MGPISRAILTVARLNDQGQTEYRRFNDMEFADQENRVMTQRIRDQGRIDEMTGLLQVTHEDYNQQYWDEMSGALLNTQMVPKARPEEVEQVKKHGVFTLVDLKEAWEVTGKGPIDTRWIDVDKGDAVRPEYRLRWVAK